MNRTEHIQLMASYNEWMNTRLYEAAMGLSDDQLNADRQAFFGSLLGTLNHLVVADIIWLKRFSTHASGYPQLRPVQEMTSPVALNQVLYPDRHELRAMRILLDSLILQWADAIIEPDLDLLLDYANMKGIASRRNFYGVIMHFFNHQTHHRGQATTLLSQYGVDVGMTDLLVITPDQLHRDN